MKLIAFLTLFVLSVTAEKARFDNYRVHSLFPQNDEQLEALKSLAKSEDVSNFVI